MENQRYNLVIDSSSPPPWVYRPIAQRNRKPINLYQCPDFAGSSSRIKWQDIDWLNRRKPKWTNREVARMIPGISGGWKDLRWRRERGRGLTSTTPWSAIGNGRQWNKCKHVKKSKTTEQQRLYRLWPLAIQPFLNPIFISFGTSNCATCGMSNERNGSRKGKTIFRFNQFWFKLQLLTSVCQIICIGGFITSFTGWWNTSSLPSYLLTEINLDYLTLYIINKIKV